MISLIDFSSPVPIVLRKRASEWGNMPFLENLLRGSLSETETVLIMLFCDFYSHECHSSLILPLPAAP